MTRRRLDDLMISRGLAADRREALRLLLGGAVQIPGHSHPKPGSLVEETAEIEIRQRTPFASRGGLKLEAALARFHLRPEGWICLDLGVSTGGFTDCLLQHGARKVYAFDVGRGQLDWKLRNDPRVVVREGFNVRFISPDDVEEPADLIVADLSFISLRLILPRLREFSQAPCLILVKPQFEAEPHEVEKGGLIRDPKRREDIVERVRQSACDLGFLSRGCFLSPVPGQKGNREYFLYLEQPPPES